jgi:hypothetical protein
MKFTIVSVLLAAASALAFPFNVERRNSIQISDLWAKASATGAAMHFIVTDPNYPEDTPTDCNLIWYNVLISQFQENILTSILIQVLRLISQGKRPLQQRPILHSIP